MWWGRGWVRKYNNGIETVERHNPRPPKSYNFWLEYIFRITFFTSNLLVRGLVGLGLMGFNTIIACVRNQQSLEIANTLTSREEAAT